MPITKRAVWLMLWFFFLFAGTIGLVVGKTSSHQMVFGLGVLKEIIRMKVKTDDLPPFSLGRSLAPLDVEDLSTSSSQYANVWQLYRDAAGDHVSKSNR